MDVSGATSCAMGSRALLLPSEKQYSVLFKEKRLYETQQCVYMGGQGAVERKGKKEKTLGNEREETALAVVLAISLPCMNTGLSLTGLRPCVCLSVLQQNTTLVLSAAAKLKPRGKNRHDKPQKSPIKAPKRAKWQRKSERGRGLSCLTLTLGSLCRQCKHAGKDTRSLS